MDYIVPNISRKNVAKNTGWIIASKIIQAILGFVIGMLIARFLGPTKFGIISYAESVVAFVVPIMNLGFSNVLVQELTNNPDEEGKIIGTSIILSTISSFVCIGGVVTYTFIADANEPVTNLVVGLFSIMLIFQAIELIQYWYQAKLLSKYTAIVSLIAYVLVSAYKVVLILLKSSLALFAIANSIDYCLIAFALLVLYRKLGGQRISFSSEVGKRMFTKSKHYIVSSLMVAIFAQTDRIMIKLMISEEAVGYYSAAIKCAAISNFVFAAIIDSFRPVIYSHKKANDHEQYERSLKKLYCVVIYLALLQSLFMTILAKYIIQLLYGEAYSNSVLALQIVVWYTTFSYMGAVRNVWILGENKQKYLWILNLGGALVNIGLNLLFINIWGIYGAALASLITQIFTNVLMNVIVWPLRHNNLLMIQGLNPKLMIEMFKRSKKQEISK